MQSKSAELSLQEFVSEQKRLLELELHAEEDTNNSQTKGCDGGRGGDGGFVLRNIDIIDTSVGLYGRTIVSFGNVAQYQSVATTTDDQSGTSKNEDGHILSSSKLLQAHRLTVGDEVQILPNNGKGFQSGGKKSKAMSGVICAVDDINISVALFSADNNNRNKKDGAASKKQDKKKKKNIKDEVDFDDNDFIGGSPPYAMIPKSNVEVHNKMLSALDQLEKYGINHPIAGEIIKAAFDYDNPNHVAEITGSKIEALESEYNLSSSKLDYSQRKAVVMALSSNFPISLIHGPPGTGKTTTVAELIRCAVHNMGWKVLVTAPSNVAVDNVLDRVMSIENERQCTDTVGRQKRGTNKASTKKKKIKAVRLGHPARIQHGIQQYSLESLVQSSEGTELVKDCRSELKEYLKTLSNAKSRPLEKRTAYREMKVLKKEIRTREEKVVGEILRDSNVVLATNVGAASTLFHRMKDSKGEPISFDLVILDEAAQALEASCWISLLRGKRAVLAGDHKQLPPTIKCSVRDVQQGLGRTLFERLMHAYDENKQSSMCHSMMLEVQYRMNQQISDWASNAMYDGKIISHDSVKDRQLSSLPEVAEKMKTQTDAKEDHSELENITLMLVDTTGCDMHETVNEAGSRYNEGEAKIVVSHVHTLINLGIRPQDIAVITPYNGQVELLRKLLLPDVAKLEIRSVDGFQGGEKEAVVLSLVRSSERGGQDGVGFLKDERRLNVAVTRAKRHCAVICDCETVSKNKFIKGLVDWFDQNGDYRSGTEYIGGDIRVVSCESLQHLQKQIDGDSSKPKKDEQPKAVKEQNTFNQATTRTTKDEKGPIEAQNLSQVEIESNRVALMERIKSFSESGKKDDELNLLLTSDYDCVVARELAKQLGLGCRDVGTRKLVLTVIKESKPVQADLEVPSPKRQHAASLPSKFAQLDIDDDSVSSNEEEKKRDNLLRQLAVEREHRQSEKLQTPVAKSSASKKKKKKGKGKAGTKQTKKKEKEEDKLDDIDDMAFLDAQIDKVQTSHGRKIDAKGKGYRSVVSCVLY